MSETPILMIPGPTEFPWRIIRAMMRPSVAHYDPKFNLDVLDKTCKGLQKVFQTANQVIVLPGSGRVGVESAIISIVEPGDRVLAVVGGIFGRWMMEIAQRVGADVTEFAVEWGKAIDMSKLDAVLAAGNYKAVLAVHNESSTGAMYPVREIGELVRRYGALYVVDAVSSLGGADLETDEWGIDLVATASQKCFCVPAGLAMVSISDRAWKAMEARQKPAVSFSLDLLKWKRMWIAKENGGLEVFGYRRQPFSMPVYLVYALQEGVAMILEEGLQERFKRHLVAAEAVRAGLQEIGLELYVDASVVSPTVTAVRNPPGIVDAQVRRIMETQYGISITGGLEHQAGKAMRIGHMGMTAAAQYVLPTMVALENALAEVGHQFEYGQGVDAARRVFARHRQVSP